jgi:hypothetical protein
MRLATLILSLILMIVVVFQSCTLGAFGTVTNNTVDTGAASSGMGIALLFLIGGAFVLPFPLVSTVVFALAGLIGSTAETGKFADLRAWGWISFLFAAMSFVGWLGKRRRARRRAAFAAPTGPTPVTSSPVGAPPTPPQSSNRWAWDCPGCRFRNQPGATFCGGCGAAQASAS